MLYLGFYFIGIVFRSKPDPFTNFFMIAYFINDVQNTNNLGVRIYNA